MTDPPSICHRILSKFDFAQVSYCLSEFVSRQSELISYSTRGCGGQEQSADTFNICYWLFSALRDSLVPDHSCDGLWKGHLLVEVLLLLLMLLLLSVCACTCRHIPYHTIPCMWRKDDICMELALSFCRWNSVITLVQQLHLPSEASH